MQRVTCCRKVDREFERLDSRRDEAGKLNYDFNDYNDYDSVRDVEQ